MRGATRICFTWFGRGLLAAIAAGVLLMMGAAFQVVRHFEGDAVLPADCAIVFGAAVYGQSTPGPAVSRRIERAVDLYHQKNIRSLYVSGGKGQGDRQSEAQVMEKVAISQGVDPKDIVREDRSRSTWENLELTKPLMGSCQTVVGISDRTHLARIKLLAARQGWGELQTIAAERRPPPRQELRTVIRETLGYVYYALRFDRLWRIGPSAVLGDGA